MQIKGAITGLMVNAQIDTSPCTGYAAAVEKCGTDYPMTNITAIGGSALGFWMVPNVPDYCSSANKVNFKKQVECVIEAIRNCGTAEFKTLLADDDTYAASVDVLCDASADFDSTCGSELLMCGSDKFPANTTEPMQADGFMANKDYYCNFFKYFGECAASNTKLANCAKTKTKATHVTIAGKLVPEACGAAAGIIVTTGLLISSIFISLFI